MQRPPRILVFDSGVGGLSILHEIRQAMPWAETVYACDNAFFPYGTKEQAALEERVEQVVLAAAGICQPDITVVACNTASTAVLPRLRARLQEPVVGVVPAIKPAAEQSISRVIGLLATPGTVRRTYTQQLINDFAKDCKVILLGTSELVSLAEQKLRGAEVSQEQMHRIVAALFEEPAAEMMDTLVLGCTHFPLLREELRRCLPSTVTLLDSGNAVARRVESLLAHHPHHAMPTVQPTLFTHLDQSIEELQPTLNQFGCGTPQLLTL